MATLQDHCSCVGKCTSLTIQYYISSSQLSETWTVIHCNIQYPPGWIFCQQMSPTSMFFSFYYFFYFIEILPDRTAGKHERIIAQVYSQRHFPKSAASWVSCHECCVSAESPAWWSEPTSTTATLLSRYLLSWRRITKNITPKEHIHPQEGDINSGQTNKNWNRNG